jgi:D-proline reductase (dithiol) PrdB
MKHERSSWWQRLNNRWYAIPAVAQWWAHRNAERSHLLVAADSSIPFAHVRKSLAQSKAVLITTAGVQLQTQPPFDMQNPDGDASYRTIPATTKAEEISITHKYYDHSDADRDLNVVFPLAHFTDLAQRGVIGGLASQHYGFMGHIEGDQAAILKDVTAREVAVKLREDGVDFAFLTPA